MSPLLPYPDPNTQTHEDKPMMSKTDLEEAYVSSAVGGSLSQVSFEGSGVRSRISPTLGGGIRGRIRGFSRTSRRNLLRRFASINRRAFRAYKGRVIAVTLTYPHVWPEDPEICKQHLKALRKRLQRRFGDYSGFWRMGIQQRGAWHFHLLLFVPPSFGPVKEMRHFVASSWYEVVASSWYEVVASSWYEVCGKVSEGHLQAGTHVEEVRRWRRATSYVERYVAKREEFPEGVKTGRIWGRWNEELLPVRWETVKITLEDAFKIRRIYRKLARMRGRGRLHRLTVFVRHENVLKLLEALGYRQEE